MEMGTCKVDVTPNHPLPLAGFAHREKTMNGIFSSITIRTFLCRTEETTILWIIGDFIWWDNTDVLHWKHEIAERFQLSSASIVFHATHNHSGPQLSNRFSNLLGVRSEVYIKELYKAIMYSVEQSLANTFYVTCKIYKGTSKLGMFRRKKRGNSIEMAPNQAVEVDDELKLIAFIDKSGRNRAIFICFACHPTVTDANELSSEFPGYVCAKLEKDFPECTIAFLQGFSGDIRPALIKDKKFFRGKLSAIKKVGDQLYSDILNTFKYTYNSFSITSIDMVEGEHSLSFQKHSNHPPIPKGLEEEWLTLTKQISDYTLRFQLIKFHETLQFFTANAEMVQAYGQFLKSLNSSIVPVGYSNGMIGYIPTQIQLLEGGYESEDSLYYFGYPHKVVPETELQLKKLWKNILNGE